MTKRLKRLWPAWPIVGIAGAILLLEYSAAPAFSRWQVTSSGNPFFVATGKWAIRFLLISLSITPIYAFTGWRFPIKLRKPAGLIAFGFASIHAGMRIFGRSSFWDLDPLIQPTFVTYGLVAFIILTLMAITSVKLTMKRMGRYWKPLHRLVYPASLLIMLHALIATTYGKRGFGGGPESAQELRIYLVILVALLLVRIPRVRNPLKRLIPFAPNPPSRQLRRKRA